MLRIKGVVALVHTPFTADDKLDEEGLCRGIDFVIQHGIDSVVVCSRIGEYYHLTQDERKRTIEIGKAHTAGRVPVGFGIMDPKQEEALDLARHGARVGIDFALSRGAVDTDPVTYYRALSSEIPTMIYDYAQNREVPAERMLPVLEQCDNLVGMKISGDPHKIAVLRKHSDLPLLCGFELRQLAAYMMGFDGVSSGMAAIMPEASVRFHQLCMEKQWQEAGRIFWGQLLPLMNCLGYELYAAAGSKHLLVWRGVQKSTWVRPPWLPLTPDHVAYLRLAAEAVGLQVFA
ncbi:MAG: dihydrodipicolinate synthase family protein [Chloroflexi bacterium]|nr:dihydrodipicolinate synthase family protein [Chloroflexota bacterium]